MCWFILFPSLSFDLWLQACLSALPREYNSAHELFDMTCSQFTLHCGKPEMKLWANFSVISWKIWTSSLVLSSPAICHHFHSRYHWEKVSILLLVVLWGSICVLYSRLCLKCRNKTFKKLWWLVCCGCMGLWELQAWVLSKQFCIQHPAGLPQHYSCM